MTPPERGERAGRPPWIKKRDGYIDMADAAAALHDIGNYQPSGSAVFITHLKPPWLLRALGSLLPRHLQERLAALTAARKHDFPVVLSTQSLHISGEHQSSVQATLNWLLPSSSRPTSWKTIALHHVASISLAGEDAIIVRYASGSYAEVFKNICRAQALFHLANRLLAYPTAQSVPLESCASCRRFSRATQECGERFITGCCPAQPFVEWCHGYQPQGAVNTIR